MWKETTQQKYRYICERKATWKTNDVKWNKQKARSTLDAYEEKFRKTIDAKENAKVVEKHIAIIWPKYN